MTDGNRKYLLGAMGGVELLLVGAYSVERVSVLGDRCAFTYVSPSVSRKLSCCRAEQSGDARVQMCAG